MQRDSIAAQAECERCGKFLLSYSAFPGGDPRRFQPDEECSTPDEIRRHRSACIAADMFGVIADVPVSGWVGPNIHVFRSQYGLGTYSYDCDCGSA